MAICFVKHKLLKYLYKAILYEGFLCNNVKTFYRYFRHFHSEIVTFREVLKPGMAKLSDSKEGRSSYKD